MDKKKILLFETSKTLAAAFDLALRSGPYLVMKIADPARIIPQADIINPDIIIVDVRALSTELFDTLQARPVPVIPSMPEAETDAWPGLAIPRPFTVDELHAVLEAALTGFTTPEESEEPLILGEAEPEEENEDELIVIQPAAAPKRQEIPAAHKPEIKTVPEPPTPPAASLSLKTEAVVTTAQVLIEVDPAETQELLADEEIEEMEELEEATPITVITPAPVITPVKVASPETSPVDGVYEISDSDLQEIGGVISFAGESDALRALLKKELDAAVKEYFWEAAPELLRTVLEEEIRKLSEHS